MVRLYLLIFVVQIALAVIALISCLSAEEEEIRALPRLAWLLIILFFPLVGSIAWFLAGRPASKGGASAEPPRPTAPDDDPDFLRKLNTDQSRRDRELFDKWEEDLQRREDELRRKDSDPDTP
ncbi:PLD nuclease N-terminal domain-containing protein [Micromonospora sp. CPCC 206061]|uniref:PLD nuclease N-terminal domain-containing protein n=1 Tax=Micromonospora sp. CPCC 206061 TaxID=3122410 RepID=UPI002FF34F83